MCISNIVYLKMVLVADFLNDIIAYGTNLLWIKKELWYEYQGLVLKVFINKSIC